MTAVQARRLRINDAVEFTESTREGTHRVQGSVDALSSENIKFEWNDESFTLIGYDDPRMKHVVKLA